LRSLPPNFNDDLLTSKWSWNEGSHIQVAVFSTVLMAGGMMLAYLYFYRYPLLQGIASKVEQAINNREIKRLQRASLYSAGVDGDNKFGSVATPSKRDDDGDGDNGPDRKADGDDGVGVEAAQDDAGRLSASIDSGLGSIADNEEEMLMNHFSYTELRAMSISEHDSSDHKNVALKNIAFYSHINLFLVCPAAVAATLAGLGIQVQNQYEFAVLVVNLFLLAFLFGLYEVLRFGPIAELSRLPGLDVTLKAKAACRKLNEQDDSLKQLLARSNIEADDPSGLRESLAPPPAKHRADSVARIDEGNFSAVTKSYAIVYAVQVALFIVGLMFALVIKQ